MSDPGKNLIKDFHSDCGVCRFWKRKDEMTGFGFCHRFPPPWPESHQTDVCGEFAVEVDP